MLFHQLRCFVGVVREGGFVRAAHALHVTQPALSYQIKQLEQEVGATLLDRGPGGVRLTQAGRVLAAHAEELLRGVRQAREAIDDLAEEPTGEVRIGTVNSVGIHFLPDVLRAVGDLYPKVKTSVLYRNSDEIIKALVSGEIELAIVSDPKKDRRLEKEVLIEEPVSLVVGRSDPLFGKKRVEPEELDGRPFVEILEGPTGRLVNEHLAAIGAHVHVVVSTDNVETVRKMVEVGLGISFLPEMVLCDGTSGSDRYMENLSHASVGPPLVRRIFLISWKDSTPSRAAEAFIGELRKQGQRWIGCKPDSCAA